MSLHLIMFPLNPCLRAISPLLIDGKKRLKIRVTCSSVAMYKTQNRRRIEEEQDQRNAKQKLKCQSLFNEFFIISNFNIWILLLYLEIPFAAEPHQMVMLLKTMTTGHEAETDKRRRQVRGREYRDGWICDGWMLTLEWFQGPAIQSSVHVRLLKLCDAISSPADLTALFQVHSLSGGLSYTALPGGGRSG